MSKEESSDEDRLRMTGRRVLPSAREVKRAIAKALEGKRKEQPRKTEKVKKLSSSRRKKLQKKEIKRTVDQQRAEIIRELAKYKLTDTEKQNILPMSAKSHSK